MGFMLFDHSLLIVYYFHHLLVEFSVVTFMLLNSCKYATVLVEILILLVLNDLFHFHVL
jgi:hypothetical protein